MAHQTKSTHIAVTVAPCRNRRISRQFDCIFCIFQWFTGASGSKHQGTRPACAHINQGQGEGQSAATSFIGTWRTHRQDVLMSNSSPITVS